MNIVMTAANRCKWAAWGPCRVTRIHGWNNTATQLYIQLQEIPPLTAAGLVPAGSVPNVKSLLAQANNGFDYEFGGGISLKELTITVSTAELSFTDPGANNGLDMTVELDTANFDVHAGDLIAGDLTTGVNSLQVWASASGPKTLLRADWVTSEAFAAGSTLVWLQLHAVNTPANGTTPLILFPGNPTNDGVTVQAFNMGDIGFGPRSGSSVSSGSGANTNLGCTLAVSTTGPTLTAISDTLASIRAIYRP